MSVCSRWGFDEGGYSGDTEEGDDEEQQSGDGYEIPIDQDNEPKEEKKNERKRVSGDGLEEVAQNAKNVAPSPFRKFRRFCQRADRRSSSRPRGSGSELPRRKRRFGKFCFCYCLSKPQTVENNNDDKPTDEDEASNSYDYIKSMIEKNDFYSRECNTHIDHC